MIDKNIVWSTICFPKHFKIKMERGVDWVLHTKVVQSLTIECYWETGPATSASWWKFICFTQKEIILFCFVEPSKTCKKGRIIEGGVSWTQDMRSIVRRKNGGKREQIDKYPHNKIILWLVGSFWENQMSGSCSCGPSIENAKGKKGVKKD